MLALSLVLPGPRHASADTSQAETFDAVAAKAATAREAGRLEDALALYRRGVSLKPDWDEGLWYVGSLLYELNRYAEAKPVLTQMLVRVPEHAGAMALRGLCEFHLGQHEDALRDLTRARIAGISQTPGIATVARYHAGILLTRLGEFETGSAVLAEFGPEGNESPQVIEAMGLNLLRLPLLPVEVPPAQRPLVRLAGQAAFAMAARRASAAQSLLDDLVSRYPTTSNVHYARGVFRLTEAGDAAIGDFEEELKVTPNHVLARLQIAFELMRRGDTAAALHYAERAAALDPQHFAARLALGQALFEQGRTNQAIAELEQAVTLAPESPQTHFVLARAYARAGRKADADREREIFTRLDQQARALRSGVHSVGGIPSAGTRRPH
jgi:tetratricopeptide (TPR) repeat protein